MTRNQLPPPLHELEPRKVCLIKPSALGDIVQTLPVLAMLRGRWPEAHIAWVVNRSLAGILDGHPQLDEVIEFDRGGRGASRTAALWRLIKRLRCGNFDLAIDLQGLFRSGLMTWATRAERRVGFSLAREGATLAYTDIVPAMWALPSWQRLEMVARAFGCTGQTPPAVVPIRAEHRAWVAEKLGGLPRPLLAVHPGAQWETKRWPPEHFADLAARAQSEIGAGVVLVGGPGERSICEQIASRLPGPAVNLAEQTPLLHLAAACETADVFLSGDTGPMHLAAAVGTRTVSVFTCTSPRESGPRELVTLGAGLRLDGPGNQRRDAESNCRASETDAVLDGPEVRPTVTLDASSQPPPRMIATQVSCAASYKPTCPTRHCMGELLPARVWPALRTALTESTIARRVS